MPNLDMKAVFESLLPPGNLWQPAPAAGFDQFLTALGENTDEIYERLYDLGSIRDPRKTPILSDLEKEYGVYTNPNLTEAVRRQQLAAIKYAKPGTASDSLLQAILRNAGFDVYVRRNHPPIDPADLLQDQWLLEAGEIDAFAGEPNAIAGRGGGELVVNGPIIVTSVDYDMQANGAAAFAGEPSAVAGFFNETTQTPIGYEIPVSSERWPYIFFITGQEWGWIDDWNFEYATIGKWVESIEANASKNIDPTYINNGIRSLKISSGPINIPTYSNCYVEQIFEHPILNECDVEVRVWTNVSANTEAAIIIQDAASGLWGTAATVPTGQSNYLASFTSPPFGITGIRLAVRDSASPSALPKIAYFDELLVETKNIQRAEIPSEREAEFKRLILKYKPLDTWAGLIVDYT